MGNFTQTTKLFRKNQLLKQKHVTKNVKKYNFINTKLKNAVVKKYILQH